MTTTWDHVLRTALINLHAFEFGYTVAFTGATLQSMIDAVDLCGGADLCAEDVVLMLMIWSDAARTIRNGHYFLWCP